MDDPNKFRQMQDEMSRFEAEISGSEPLLPPPPPPRRIIGANTFGTVQQQLEQNALPTAPPLRPLLKGILPPPPPPPSTLIPFNGGVPPLVPPMGPMPPMPHGMLFGTVPPPPPPPSLLIPSQVQRLRPPGPVFPDHSHLSFPPGGPPTAPFMRLVPPPPAPPKPKPVVVSGAPKLYKPKQTEVEKKKDMQVAPKLNHPAVSKPLKILPEPPVVIEPSNPVPAPVATETQPPTKSGKKEKKNRKVVRTAGGQVWEDQTLLDWSDDDFRLFCGDLGNDVTDELLIRTFSKYTSFNRAKVVRDKRTNKSKGFGFISFKEPGDFIKAMKEMNGRYVGSRPIKLRKSTWKNRALDVVRKKEKEKAALLALLTSGGKY